ncbi:MAG: hypothetical protein K0M40_03425 [Prolixibacteraceae bacterium]|nr:hypothetical protein [Prolixibacteraceae bacterium]
MRDRQGRGLPYLGNITHQVNTSNVVVAEYNFDACSVKLGFCECSETKTVVELIPMSEAGRERRRRSADDWSYTLDGNDKALLCRVWSQLFGMCKMVGIRRC